MVSQGLVRNAVDGVHVTGYADGFVVQANGAAWHMGPSGGLTRLRLDRRRAEPRPGDLLLEGYYRLALFRPATRTLYGRVARPAGTGLTDVDGRGTWWALGDSDAGQRVVWTARPGEPWVRRLIGPDLSGSGSCTCQWQPDVRGRGAVVVVDSGAVQSISHDYGATWRTIDLDATEPFRTTYANLRLPLTSALPDGRVVTGYMRWWVATDATNASFRRIGLRSSAMWRAGLTSGAVIRAGRLSVDGGRSWLRCDAQPSGAPSQHGTM